MRILNALILLALLGQVNGHDFLGIGSFFGSAQRSTETLRKVIQLQCSEFQTALDQSVAPQLQRTMDVVRVCVDNIVNITKRLERRLEESLEKFDDITINIGQSITVDSCVVVTCVILFWFCSIIDSNSRDSHVKHELLTILMVISLITATGVILRVFYFVVLKLELITTAATLKFCVIYPMVIVVLWKVSRLVCIVLCKICAAVYFFVGGPRLIIFITIDGPILWIWRAYKYALEKKSRTPVLMAVSLPWFMFFISLSVYNFILHINESKDQLAFVTGLLVAYLYFYVTAIYLYAHHQKPVTQESLRVT